MSQDDYDYDRTYGERWGGDGHRPDDFGPAMTGRHRRVSFTKALGGVFNIAFSALMIVLLALGGLAVYASSQIQREPVEGLVSGGPTLNVLVVGSDSRDGFTPEQLLELGTEAVDGRRTDTIFLLSIDGGRAAMLSRRARRARRAQWMLRWSCSRVDEVMITKCFPNLGGERR